MAEPHLTPSLQLQVSPRLLCSLLCCLPSANIKIGFQFINIQLAEGMVPVSQSLKFICLTGSCASQKHKPLGASVETLNTFYSFIRETIYIGGGGMEAHWKFLVYEILLLIKRKMLSCYESRII